MRQMQGRLSQAGAAPAGIPPLVTQLIVKEEVQLALPVSKVKQVGLPKLKYAASKFDSGCACRRRPACLRSHNCHFCMIACRQCQSGCHLWCRASRRGVRSGRSGALP